MLLQKIDFWEPAYLIYLFSKFSKVSVFKPNRAFKTKGSFYLVAQDIQPELPAAKEALKEWRDLWYHATCRGKAGTGSSGTGKLLVEHDEKFVKKVLEEFGEKLIEMARPIWALQADTLKTTNYAGGSGWD